METLDIGNETAESPFFSPDGRWIGYTAAPGLAIRKVSVTGGSPVTIAQVAAGASGSWGAGRIVFADATGLYRLPEGGGTPETLSITLEPNEQAAFPEILPGGEVVLFTVLPIRTNLIGPSSGSAQARIDALDLRTGVQSTIVAGGGRPRYARSGHLLYASRGTVYAVAFDVERLQTRGERVQVSADWGSAQFDVSDDGTLAYLSGQVLWESELVWVDHNGQDESLGAPLGQYSYARLSPDGTRVALDGYVVANREMFIWDIPGKRLERLTTDPAEDAVPVWSPDGKRLVFSSARYGYTNVFWQAADGSGTPEQLLKRDYVQFASNFTPDGQLFVSGQDPDRDWDVFVLSVDGSQKMLPLITGKGLQTNPEISKDGKWIAYQSNQSGQYEVYVRPYPQVDGGRWQISLAGGKEPLWSLDGRKLYYKDFTGALMAVTVTPSPAFSAGVPSKLIDGPPYRHEDSRLSARTYDLSLDGSRFLMIKLKNQPKPVQIVVTTNWFTELNAQLPLH
jgi:serine/threonine-protein kinase